MTDDHTHQTLSSITPWIVDRRSPRRWAPWLSVGLLAALIAVTTLAVLQKACASGKQRDNAHVEATSHYRAVSYQSNESLKAAYAQIGVTRGYDSQYRKIDYPMGDVPIETGVCTDVVVRAWRAAGIDLQRTVYEDMRDNFTLYPKKWGLKAPDPNIDHRRVPNLQTYFQRKGYEIVLPARVNHGSGQLPFINGLRPGDVVTWDLVAPDAAISRSTRIPTHIGIVADRFVRGTQRPLIIHNIGSGAQIEDVLFTWTITGHYRRN
jgi:uncharacterized protein